MDIIPLMGVAGGKVNSLYSKHVSLVNMLSVLRASQPFKGAGVAALTSLSRQKHSLPELPYGYKALEPVISGEIMELHHQKHHATYVNNLNAAEEQLKQCVDEGIDYINIICLLTEVMFVNINNVATIQLKIPYFNLKIICMYVL